MAIAGFLLVTTDPPHRDGGSGSAAVLVRKRLARREWPIYETTRHRKDLVDGVKLAFYVGGQREQHGEIIATAEVAKTCACKQGERIDSDEYLTKGPSIVLQLKDVQLVPKPVRFVDALPKLSCCPSKPLPSWGILLQGGCRPIPDVDWDFLCGASS